MSYDGASVAYRNAVCMTENCSVIDCEINHPVHGWIPTSLNNSDPVTTALYQRIVADEAAEPYEEPAPPAPAVPQSISRRQFYTQLLATGTLTVNEYFAALRGDTPMPGPLQAIIDSLPLDQQPVATGLLIAATDFQRDHPLVNVFKTALGLTVPQVDQFFIEASLL